MYRNLLLTARLLVKASPRRPRQTDLRRAVSTIYYAMFHFLAEICADILVGSGVWRKTEEWVLAYRSLDHGQAKRFLATIRTVAGSPAIVQFSDLFVRAMDERNKADYDPSARFARAEVLSLIEEAELAINAMKSIAREEKRKLVIRLRFRPR